MPLQSGRIWRKVRESGARSVLPRVHGDSDSWRRGGWAGGGGGGAGVCVCVCVGGGGQCPASGAGRSGGRARTAPWRGDQQQQKPGHGGERRRRRSAGTRGGHPHSKGPATPSADQYGR